MDGFCCHCGKAVGLGEPSHGRSDRFMTVGHKCPKKRRRTWGFGRQLWFYSSIGMLTDPFEKPIHKKKRFKRPDKSIRRAFTFARSMKRSWIDSDGIQHN